MKVIFLKDVGGVGRQGEVKDISDGYALNMLIPRGFAQQATEAALQAHTRKQQEHEAARKREEERIAALIRGLHGASFETKIKATEKGGLFESVDAQKILKILKIEQGLELPLASVRLEKPIKTTGEHSFRLELFGAGADVRLLVRAK